MTKNMICVCACLLLASCMPTQPFVDSWTAIGAAEKAPRSSADHVAVCYNRYYVADTKQLQALAEAECQKTSRHARYQGGSQFTCCLAAPSTAYYDCVK